jgi:glycerol kinase
VALVIVIDAGTTGVRAVAVGPDGAVRASAYSELSQHFPRPGWVEHDPADIWAAAVSVLAQVLSATAEAPAAIGITNQRETVVAWDRRRGEALHRAIVWQDRRTASMCESLAEAGHTPLVRGRTGLVLDPYFSATKMAWLLREGGVKAEDLAFGTVDSWLIWNLTGGHEHLTDVSNASRTLLFDIGRLSWDPELADLFGVPLRTLPEVRPSSGRLATTAAGVVPGLAGGVPISGVAGDQQAALFGQCCFSPGMTKNTYGTGSFVLMNTGPQPPDPAEGLLTTVAWQLGAGEATYALEGSIFVSGAALQWLRDGLGVIAAAAEAGPLAASVPDSAGAYMVPAFTGLGSPWWDPYARGALIGLSRGVGRAHLVRAAVEAMAYQTRDVVDAMVSTSGQTLGQMRVDGGASAMDFLLQFQSDLLNVAVLRSASVETTALGAAFLAGLAEGVWGSLDEVASCWRADKRFDPAGDRADAYAAWRRAVERARAWEPPTGP